MKEGIHPDYKQTTITCACGEVIEQVQQGNIKLKFVQSDHPFFTGKQKLVDTGGRVEKFNRRFQQNSKARLIFLQQLFLLQFIS